MSMSREKVEKKSRSSVCPPFNRSPSPQAPSDLIVRSQRRLAFRLQAGRQRGWSRSSAKLCDDSRLLAGRPDLRRLRGRLVAMLDLRPPALWPLWRGIAGLGAVVEVVGSATQRVAQK